MKICVQMVTRRSWLTSGKTYIDGDEIDLGVTVLASLGGRHVDDLARTA